MNPPTLGDYGQIAAALCAIVAIVISVRANRLSSAANKLASDLNDKIARINKSQHLDMLVNRINDALVEYDVPGPLACEILKGKSEEEKLKFQKKCVILLHHINYFRSAFETRALMEAGHFEQIEHWFTHTVYGWIKSDPHLVEMARRLLKNRDFQHHAFSDYIEGILRKLWYEDKEEKGA